MGSRELEKFNRYNQILINSLNIYLRKNKSLLNSNDYAAKYYALLDLKKNLDSSAVLNKKIPIEFVPMKPIYEELYSLLFEKDGTSYLQLLALWMKNKEKKEIESNLSEKEKFILSKISKDMLKIKLSNIIPSRIKSGVKEIFNSMLNVRIPGTSFQRGILFIFIAVALINSTVLASGQIAEQPFITENVKIEEIQKRGKMAIEALEYYEKYSAEVKMLPLYESRINDNMGLIHQWIDERGLMDPKLWVIPLANKKGVEDSLKLFRERIQKKLPDCDISIGIKQEKKINDKIENIDYSDRGYVAPVELLGLPSSFNVAHITSFLKTNSKAIQVGQNYSHHEGEYKNYLRVIRWFFDAQGRLNIEFLLDLDVEITSDDTSNIASKIFIVNVVISPKV